MSAERPTPPTPRRPIPFDREPWPGEPGYGAGQEPLQAPVPEPEQPLAPVVEPEPVDLSSQDAGDSIESAPSEPDLAAPEIPLVIEHSEGEFRLPSGYQAIEGFPIGAGRAVAIVVSRFNGQITSGLLESALTELERVGIPSTAITIMPVPGAFELPLAAMALAKSRRYACIVALGCVIRGETPHFEYVASESASGLQLAGLETGIPVAFGVLTVDTVEQAQARLEKGAEAVRSALELADIFGKLRSSGASGQ